MPDALTPLHTPIRDDLWSAESGFGDPLVLIHGMGSAHTAWRLLVPELEKSYRVILVDLPGHGDSSYTRGENMEPRHLAESVFATVKALGYQHFHLVGSSLGGWVALELGSLHPEAVLSITALAPAGLWLVPETKRVAQAAHARRLARLLYRVAPLIARFRWAKKMGFALVSPQWEALPNEICIDATNAMGRSQGYFPAWDALLGKRFESLVSPEIPVTVIFGDTDNTLPAAFSQERTLAPRHARWIDLPRGGHAPMWDHAEDCIRLISETTARSA